MHQLSTYNIVNTLHITLIQFKLTRTHNYCNFIMFATVIDPSLIKWDESYS